MMWGWANDKSIVIKHRITTDNAPSQDICVIIFINVIYFVIQYKQRTLEEKVIRFNKWEIR